MVGHGKIGDRFHRAYVVALRRRHALAETFFPRAIDGEGFDLGAAQVDADTDLCLWCHVRGKAL